MNCTDTQSSRLTTRKKLKRYPVFPSPNDEERFQKCHRASWLHLGVEPHLPFEGLRRLSGTTKSSDGAIRLCWHPEDETISHWHEEGTPAQKRRRLAEDDFTDDFS